MRFNRIPSAPNRLKTLKTHSLKRSKSIQWGTKEDLVFHEWKKGKQIFKGESYDPQSAALGSGEISRDHPTMFR